MKFKILKSIGTGILNGFPLIQSIVKQVKGVKQDVSIHTDVSQPEKKRIDMVALLFEAAIVILIIGFVTGKISIESLERIINLIK